MTVKKPIVVSIGILWIRAQAEFGRVVHPITIRIAKFSNVAYCREWIQPIGQLPSVQKTVTVGIRKERICIIHIDFVSIRQPVTVGIGIYGIRANSTNLCPIGNSVHICVSR